MDGKKKFFVKKEGKMSKKISAIDYEKYKKFHLKKQNEEFLGKCTMPGCKNRIYCDTEYFKDGEGNIFCSTECILEWYGIEKG